MQRDTLMLGHEPVRDAIIQTAVDQLKQGGYDYLNFAALADTHKTTRANLHHHFGNKEGLAVEATELYVRDNMAYMQDLASRHQGDFPAYLAALEAGFIERVKRTGRSGNCVCTQLISGENVPEQLTEKAQAFFKVKEAKLKEMIRASQASGTLVKEVSPGLLAVTASALLMGLAQKALISGDEPDFGQHVRGTLTEWIQNYMP